MGVISTSKKVKRCKNKTRKMRGGVKNIIIHIAGTQGSGKSTIGNKLLQEYPNEIYVCDLDDLHGDFLTQSLSQSYQKYIDKYIRSHSDKPIIFVGLDAELCLGLMEDSDIYYNLYSKYNYYILSNENTLKQRFFRQIDKLYTRKENFFNEWVKNPDEIQDKLFRFVNLNKWKENNSKCDNLYDSRKYKVLPSEEIFSRILMLLKK
jgi:adenylate kinase family enzyme